MLRIEYHKPELFVLFYDYEKEDFTKTGMKYDLILDVIATHSIIDYKRALNSDGSYIMIGGSGQSTEHTW